LNSELEQTNSLVSPPSWIEPVLNYHADEPEEDVEESPFFLGIV
jgi:hypothetical protein